VPTTFIPDEVLALASDAPGLECLDIQAVLRGFEENRGAKRKDAAADTYARAGDIAAYPLMVFCLVPAIAHSAC
jgi:hypothetical protein